MSINNTKDDSLGINTMLYAIVKLEQTLKIIRF